MTQASFPFEGIDTTETQFSKWARHFNSGVDDVPTGDDLSVSAGTGLAVEVEAGEAMVRGHYYTSDATESLSLTTADATDDRIDTVVLRLDPVANTIVLAVRAGTPDAAPVAPTLVQTDAGVFEQALADVLVPATSGVPTTITDRREFMGTRLGSWSTAGRPTPAGRVLFGFNTDTGRIEFYNVNTPAWEDVTQAGDNLIYNGAMQVAQRGTSETGITSAGYYTADRWRTIVTTLGTWTQTLEADGPTGSGFTKSLKMECTTADAAPAASDIVTIQQSLEGQDVQSIKKGTSSAESLMLSFWVKSDTTGTYIASLFDSDNTRLISKSYSISSADTWERKTITLDADTTGTLDNDNGGSLQLQFVLGAGSDFTSGTLATSWESYTAANRAVGQTNLAAATSNYWQVTGVQLEAGTVATPFEHKTYGVELAECQRYFERIAEPGDASSIAVCQAISTTVAVGTLRFSNKRANPSFSFGAVGDFRVRNATNTQLTCTSLPFAEIGNQSVTLIPTVASGLVAGNATEMTFDGDAAGFFDISAEL